MAGAFLVFVQWTKARHSATKATNLWLSHREFNGCFPFSLCRNLWKLKSQSCMTPENHASKQTAQSQKSNCPSYEINVPWVLELTASRQIEKKSLTFSKLVKPVIFSEKKDILLKIDFKLFHIDWIRPICYLLNVKCHQKSLKVNSTIFACDSNYRFCIPCEADVTWSCLNTTRWKLCCFDNKFSDLSHSTLLPTLSCYFILRDENDLLFKSKVSSQAPIFATDSFFVFRFILKSLSRDFSNNKHRVATWVARPQKFL